MTKKRTTKTNPPKVPICRCLRLVVTIVPDKRRRRVPVDPAAAQFAAEFLDVLRPTGLVARDPRCPIHGRRRT
jgi:hypothetical protein